jgi:hypothetical protein
VEPLQDLTQTLEGNVFPKCLKLCRIKANEIQNETNVLKEEEEEEAETSVLCAGSQK